MVSFISDGKLLRAAYFGVIMVVLVVAVQGYFAQRSMPTDQAPAVSGRLTDGRRADLSVLDRDQPVLLYFWASWCTECRAINSAVQKVAADYAVLSVTMSSGNQLWLDQYMQAKNMSFPVLNDTTGDISREWGITTVPAFAVVKGGKVYFITTGYTTSSGLRLRLWLTDAVVPLAKRLMARLQAVTD